MKTKPLTLAGNARHQEANRKRILRGLRLLKQESLAKAQKASDLADALAACDLAMIASGERSTRKLLREAFEIDDCDCSSGRAGGAVKDLIGSDNDYVVDQVLRTGRDIAELNRAREEWRSPAEAQEANSKPQALALAQPTLCAEAVLAEAASIVEDAIEIDWTDNPSCDRERDIRLAIIRNIEREIAEGEARYARLGLNKDGDELHVASRTYFKLQLLCPDGDVIGADLFDALERWRETYDNEQKRNKELERRSQIAAALRSLKRSMADGSPDQ